MAYQAPFLFEGVDLTHLYEGDSVATQVVHDLCNLDTTDADAYGIFMNDRDFTMGLHENVEP